MSLMQKDDLIAKDVLLKIHEGKYSGLLPSERFLAEKYGVSRNTIRSMFDILVSSGVLGRRDGRLYVLSAKFDWDMAEIIASHEAVEKMSTKVLSIENIEADKSTAELIQHPLGTAVTKLTYVRKALMNGKRVVLSLDTAIVSDTVLGDDIWLLREKSILYIIRHKLGAVFSREQQHISLKRLNGLEAKDMEVKPGLTVVNTESLFQSMNGEIFLHLTSLKLPEYTVLAQPNCDIDKKVGGFVE